MAMLVQASTVLNRITLVSKTNRIVDMKIQTNQTKIITKSPIIMFFEALARDSDVDLPNRFQQISTPTRYAQMLSTCATEYARPAQT